MDTAYYVVSITKIKLRAIVAKKYAKVDIKASFLFLSSVIPLFCSKYFVQHSLRKQIFGHGLTQCPANFNFLTFFTTSKPFSNF